MIRPAPNEHQVNILPARQSDLAAIMALERSGFATAEQWSERSWQGELLGENRTILIARSAHPLGVISLKTTGELADLHRLVVAPDRRRHGIGSDLVWAGLMVVRRQGVQAVILEVDYTNEAAIALYQRIGFEQLSVRRHYYGPDQHALIMKLYDLQQWPDKVFGLEITDD
jgi:ribosomal-protein-alanine N-acetyltransferase